MTLVYIVNIYSYFYKGWGKNSSAFLLFVQMFLIFFVVFFLFCGCVRTENVVKTPAFEIESRVELIFLSNGYKHKDYVFYVDMWQDLVVSGSADNTVSVWNWENRKLVTNISFDYKGKWGIPVNFSKDGTFLVAGAYENLVVFEVTNLYKIYSKVFAHKSGVQSIYISKGDLVLTGGSDGNLILWNFPDLSIVRKVSTGLKEVWSVAVSDSRDYAVCGGSGDALCVFTFPELKLKKRIENKYPIEFVDFSSNGKFFLFADAGGNIFVYEINDLTRPKSVLTAHIDSVLVAKFLRDNVVVSGGRDGDLYFFSLSSGNVIKKISVGSSVYSLDFGINNEMFVVGNEKGDVLFYKYLLK